MYVGSGKSQPLHIHMLSILADLSVAAADRLRGDALDAASMHADVHQLKNIHKLLSHLRKGNTQTGSCSNQSFIQASYLGLNEI